MKIRVARPENRYDAKEVQTYVTELPDEVAQFAMELIRAHANVAGIQDGEDSCGRAKLSLQTPEDLVERSFKIAELAYGAARARGHMVPLPDLNEINAELDAELRAAARAS